MFPLPPDLKSRIIQILLRILLSAAVPALLLQSCKVPVSTGIEPDSWYICEELNLALRFNAANSGDYITLNKALATPKSFRMSKTVNSFRFRFAGKESLKGRIIARTDSFLLITRERRYIFVLYSAPKLPNPPYRYINELFPSITKEQVNYGHASGYYTSKKIEKRENKTYSQVLFDVSEGITSNIWKPELPLHMDIYQPENDIQQLRPLIVLLHAGAFIAGDKSDELVSTLAAEYARKGFVVASVNYRIGYVFLPGSYANLERAMYSAVQDVRAALRYLSHNSSKYRIDPQYTYLGGNSAGGILALKTALLDETMVWPSVRGNTMRLRSDLGCLDCSGNNLYGPFTIRGVINMWGAVDNINLISSRKSIPILSMHGDKDPVVPYGTDYPFTNVSARVSAFFSKKLHGSASIHSHASALGIDHRLYTFEGYQHEPHFDIDHNLIAENYATITEQISLFLQDLLIVPMERPHGTISVTPDELTASYWLPQDFYKNYSFACDNCLILQQTSNTARIVWISGADDYQLRYAGIGPHGQVGNNSLRIVVIE